MSSPLIKTKHCAPVPWRAVKKLVGSYDDERSGEEGDFFRGGIGVDFLNGRAGRFDVVLLFKVHFSMQYGFVVVVFDVVFGKYVFYFAKVQFV